MRLNFIFAIRYLFSGAKRNVVHVISTIAMMGIGIGAFAMIVVLSAFNGLEDLVGGLYSSFDADIEVTPTEGKVFHTSALDSIRFEDIMDDIVSRSFVLEETVMLKYGDNQVFGRIKGVDEGYLRASGLDTLVFEGRLNLGSDDKPKVLLGYGLASKLNVYLRQIFRPITIYSAKRDASPTANLDNAFKIKQIQPAGIFDINPDVNFSYVLTSLAFSQALLDYENKASALEFRVREGADLNALKQKIVAKLGSNYTVKTKFELNELLYKTNNTEKWITFFILIFILLIATFNVIGSITMLILDKQEDIFIMRSIGMTKQRVKSIFFTEGFLITFIGGLLGLVLGAILTIYQKHVGLLKLQEGTIAEYYPVSLEMVDVFIVLLAIAFIACLASYFPTKILLNRILASKHD